MNKITYTPRDPKIAKNPVFPIYRPKMGPNRPKLGRKRAILPNLAQKYLKNSDFTSTYRWSKFLKNPKMAILAYFWLFSLSAQNQHISKKQHYPPKYPHFGGPRGAALELRRKDSEMKSKILSVIYQIIRAQMNNR